METWATLFDRAAAFGVDADAVAEALRERREGGPGGEPGDAEGDAGDDGDGGDRADERDRVGGSDGDGNSAAAAPSGDRPEPSPARVVADADVLAADLLVGGHAREALDGLRAHSWTALVASDALLDDAAAVIAELADADLAAAWRERAGAWREPAAHPPGDHPALASAYRGGAMHLLSLDDRLTAAGTAAGLNDRFPVSVREPRAFAALFDAASLYPEVVGTKGTGEYPGPDRDPRE